MAHRLKEIFAETRREHDYTSEDIDALAATASPILEAILRRREGTRDRMLFVGLCGAQGSGKSTIAAAVARALREEGLAVASVSLDDFYLSRLDRLHLAREVHPLLQTRGVPGTHDIGRALALLAALASAGPADEVRLPAFDKNRDDRVAFDLEPAFRGRADIFLLEGWCVGAAAQRLSALTKPVNALERDEDGDGIWRGYVNAQLAGPYRQLFEAIDLLALLKAPSFEQARLWRREQEAKLRARFDDRAASRAMDDTAVDRFVLHYERLTRHILAEMPARADVVVALDIHRHPGEIRLSA